MGGVDVVVVAIALDDVLLIVAVAVLDVHDFVVGVEHASVIANHFRLDGHGSGPPVSVTVAGTAHVWRCRQRASTTAAVSATQTPLPEDVGQRPRGWPQTADRTPTTTPGGSAHDTFLGTFSKPNTPTSPPTVQANVRGGNTSF
jgi:hypothetical protein